MSRRDWLRFALIIAALGAFAIIWVPFLARLGEPQSVWIMEQLK